METEVYQENADLDIISEEKERLWKLDSPFHRLQKDDFLDEEVFCDKCGNKSYPLIIEKPILDKREIAETKLTTDELKRPIKSKEYRYTNYHYCEILKCCSIIDDNSGRICGEIFFRTFIIGEYDKTPKKISGIIPKRKDKIPIPDKSENEKFVEIYERYKEAVIAYNLELNYASGVSTRSSLEKICKLNGHFDKILNNRINGKILTEDEIAKIKRKIGLEEQVDLLIPELMAKAPNVFSQEDINNIKNMMYWGHGLTHGNFEPTPDELLSGFEIMEEIFRILYFDSIDEFKRKQEEERRQQEIDMRQRNLSQNHQRFDKFKKG